MKRIKYLLGILLVAVLTSCAAMGYASKNQVGSIAYGMSQIEVEQLMKGKPDYKRFVEDHEQWEYRRIVGLDDKDTIILIDFVDGKVVEFNSFPDPTPRRNPTNAR